MNFRRRCARDEPEINLVPLVDLLLVILIFLMVTTTYSQLGRLQLNLPGAAAERAVDRDEDLVVAVLRDGRAAIDGGEPAARGPAALAAALAAAARGRPAPPLVVIHADAGATHQAVVAVLDAARAAGLPRATFTTRHPD